jgi:hypothetical protein
MAAAASGGAPAPLPLPEGATLLAAGPEGSFIDRIAAQMLPLLARAPPDGARIGKTNAGGVDGVTGANQFDASAAADGSAAMLVPGCAALAWLAGDPRAQFDPAHWIAIAGGVTPAVLIGRAGIADIAAHRRLRVAAARRSELPLAALLCLELLGAPAVPVSGVGNDAEARAAFAAGTIDFYLLSGSRAEARADRFLTAGVRPVFCLGAPDARAALAPDPAFPGLPDFGAVHRELRGAAPSGPLFEAWRAAAMATQLAFVLVLPQLTSAASVALWREAGARAGSDAAMRALAGVEGMRLLISPEVSTDAAMLTPGTQALLEMRGWLSASRNTGLD